MRGLIIVFTLLGIFLGSCKTQRVPQKEHIEKTHSTKDSVFMSVSIIPRDTIVKITGDSLKLQTTIQPDGTFLPQIVETNSMRLLVEQKGNLLKAECYCKDLEVKVKLLERKELAYRELTQYLSERLKIKEQNTQVKAYIPKYAKWLMGLGILAILALMITIRIFMRKV